MNDHQISNRQMIQLFETDSLPGGSFHQADHVRLAFAYLSEYSTFEALEKFSVALRRFAAIRQKSDLYNETITCAYFFIIRERMARIAQNHCREGKGCKDGKDWREFAARNPDLLVWKNGILTRYYKEATLKSDLARSVFVMPDKCVTPTLAVEVERLRG